MLRFTLRSLSIVITITVASMMTCSVRGQQTSNWFDLFDGQSLDGWTQRGGTAKYEVSEGAIVGTAVVGTPNSFLCTDADYADFELALEFWVDDGLNSGIQIRSASRDDFQQGRVHGYQVEIDPSDRGWTAGIYDEARAGWLFDLKNNEAARGALKHNEWNQLRIVANQNRIRTWLNGIAAADFTEATVRSGFIALQVHSIGESQRGLQVRWRKIRLLDLAQRTEGLP